MLSGGNDNVEPEIEVMYNITNLTFETQMGFDEIWELPYAIFLSYLKYVWLRQMGRTEEGREALNESKTNVISATEPDWGKVRQFTK